MSHTHVSNQVRVKRKDKSIAQHYPETSQTTAHSTDIKRLSHRKRSSSTQMKDRNILNEDVKKKIITFLKDKKLPQRTLAIAKACNFLTSKEVNPTIYHLERQGSVVKCDSSPPTWKISSTESVALRTVKGQSSSKIKTNSQTDNKNKNKNKKVLHSAAPKSPKDSEVKLVATAEPLQKSKLVDNCNEMQMDDFNRFQNASLDKTRAPGAYVPRDPERETYQRELYYQSYGGRDQHLFNPGQRGRGGGFNRQHLANNRCYAQGSGYYTNDGFNLARQMAFQNNRRKGGTKHQYHHSQGQRNKGKNVKMKKTNSATPAPSVNGDKGERVHNCDSNHPAVEGCLPRDVPISLSLTSPSSNPPPVSSQIDESSRHLIPGNENHGLDCSSKRSDEDSDFDDNGDYYYDSDDDSDEIQTRIRDMIFTSRAIEPAAIYVNEYDYEEDEGESNEMKLDNDVEGKTDTEMWEEGLSDDTSPAVVLNFQDILNADDEAVDSVLELLYSIPLGTTTKALIMSRLDLSESEIESHLAACQDRGLITQTEIGYIKITEAGRSAFEAHEQIQDRDYECDKVQISTAGSENISVSASSLQEKKSFSIGRGNVFLPLSSSSPVPCIAPGPSNDVKSRSSSSSTPSSCGPAPSPAFLLKNNDLFKMDPRVHAPTRGPGLGRGQRLNMLLNPVKPGIQSKDTEHRTSTTDKDAIQSSVMSDHSLDGDNNRIPHAGSASLVESVKQNGFCQRGDGMPLVPSTGLSKTSPPSSSSLSSLQPSSTSPSRIPTQEHFRPQPLLQTPSVFLSSQQQQQQQQQQHHQMASSSLSLSSSLPSSSSSSTVSQAITDKRPPLLETPTSTILGMSSGQGPSYSNTALPVKQPLLPDPGLSSPSAQPTHALTAPTVNATSLQINSESFAALNKNPISAFMEYAQSRKLTSELKVVSAKGPAHKPLFFVSAFLGNRRLSTVSCHNKKDGRKSAAEHAMRALINEGAFQIKEEISVMKMSESDMTPFDKIAALTHQKFNQLIASIPESFTGRKVIAGLVLKMGPSDVGSVIAIGSGNRCITGDKLSLEGHTVNDCHAEIITRRGFLRFLYNQLATYKKDCDHPIFEKSQTSGKLKVKDNVTFHLYISTAPCGDGALFSPRDAESNSGALADADGVHCPTFTTQVHGVLRTKMEGGEGTIPINPAEIVQTWDGIVRGERLRTMSCSDKICRWNVLGLQGALLSHFVDTIYLSSLTLGFLFDHGHLSRAVCCRLDRGDTSFKNELPQGYRLNHPSLGRVTACDPPRETQKTKSYSINWSACDDRPELLDGTMGHCHTGIENKIISRITKDNLYRSFKSLCGHLGRHDLLRCSSYLEAKQMSRDFTSAKKTLMSQFVKSKCGIWVSKPMEEEMFN